MVYTYHAMSAPNVITVRLISEDSHIHKVETIPEGHECLIPSVSGW